jgi:5,10-methylenetetrahydromethanopterin reductase
MFEIWRAGGSSTGASAELARAVEAEGWDGQMFMDSQCLSADPYAQMGAWAVSTQRIRLSTGVTNPCTRNLAVTAAGAASIQAISGGRAVLGIGRGDSALAWLGHAPAGLAAFERALASLQALLRGEEIAFGDSGDSGGSGEAPSLDRLSLGARPQSVQLRWLPKDLPKVPLDVAATGPKVIAMAAAIAERVTFSVGAERERLAWALNHARAAEPAGGAPVSYGAQLLVVCHTDAEAALEVAMRFAPPLARFQVMQSKAPGLPGADREDSSYEAIRQGYDMTRHGVIEEKQRLTRGALTPEFVRRFAIVGSPEHCAERLLALRRLGLERIVAVGPGFYPEAWGDARSLFVNEVLPALRSAAS